MNGPNNKKRIATLLALILIGIFVIWSRHLEQTSTEQRDPAASSATSPEAPAKEEITEETSEAPAPAPTQEAEAPTSTSPAVAPSTHTTTSTSEKAATAQSEKSAEPAAPQIKKVADECFQVEFKHKKIASHSDGEACTHHQNLVHVPIPEGMAINAKSVCIRVNGTPVNFKKLNNQPTDFVIDSVAGPNAVISARFCTGALNCSENCKVPKDEFLTAIGADTDSFAAPGKIVQWNPANDKKKPNNNEVELDRELSSLGDALKDAKGAARDVNLFDGWILENETPSKACLNNRSRANETKTRS